MPGVDGGLFPFQRAFDDIDGADHAGAKAARIGENYLQRQVGLAGRSLVQVDRPFPGVKVHSFRDLREDYH